MGFGANLKQARQAKGWTLERLAQEAEMESKGYISALESGKRPMPPGRTLERLAVALGVSVPDLVGANIRSVPIIDSVAAGRLADPVAQIENGHQTIEISGLPAGDYFATRVDGDSMDRLSPPGSLILVNRAEREPLPGRRYVFARRGATTYKRYERDPIRLVPESTNPNNEPIFPRSEEEWDVIGRVRLTILDDL